MSNGKHLTKGSSKPVLPDDGKLRIYSMRYCPYAHRAHLVLNAKKVPHHSIFIHLKEKPEWFIDVSPSTKVPALELVNEPGSPTLIESLIIAEYLDEKYAENPLLPKDPLKKAQDKILIERFNALAGAYFKAVLYGEPSDNLWTQTDIFEQELVSRGSKYYSGDKAGFVDYMFWPWFERLEGSEIAVGEKLHFDRARYPQLAKWVDAMLQDEAVKPYWVKPEIHGEYLRTRIPNKPVYDLLDN